MTTVALPFPALVHDFALTATSMIVVATPMVTPNLPLALILGQSSFADALRYRPELGVFVGVIDRESGVAHWHRADPFLCFHLANAYDEGDEVVVDLCAYADDGFLSIAQELMRGPIRTPTASQLLRLRIDRGGRPVQTRALLDHSFEFPRVADALISSRHRLVFGLTWDDPRDMPRRVSAVDVDTGGLSRAPAVAGEWAGECVPVAKAGATDEAESWLLSVVLNARAERTELHVLDAEDLPAGPVARIRLPHVVPFGFHGSWVADPTTPAGAA